MKSKRPVNLSLGTVLAVNLKSPVAIASILHRISGIVVFTLIPVLLYLLQASLESEQSFAEMKAYLADAVVCKALLFVVLAALAYHLVIGSKHLLQDFGIGETLKGGRLMATVALIIAAVAILAVLVGVVTL